MPTTPTIEFDAEKALRAMDAYPKRTQKATMRALNRAGDSGRSLMGSSIAKDMGLKAKDAKERVRITKATMERLEVKLQASKKRIPLMDFGAKGPLPSFGKGRGVTYKIGSGGRGRVPSGFLAKLTSEHVGVFVRKGKGRLPIKELFGPSVGQVFEKYRDPVIAQMRQTFTERLAHELRFAETEGGA